MRERVNSNWVFNSEGAGEQDLPLLHSEYKLILSLVTLAENNRSYLFDRELTQDEIDQIETLVGKLCQTWVSY